MKTRNFGAFDGLRCIFMLLIMWAHTSGVAKGVAMRFALIGPDIFFAFSGFLITTLLLRERARNGRISLRNFYVRRALRIIPPYAVVLAIYVALVLVLERNTPRGHEFLSHIGAYLTYTVNWFVPLGPSVSFYHSWTLSTEEQFYVVWPVLLIAAFALAKGRIWAPLAVLGVLMVISVGTGFIADPHQLPWRIPASISVSLALSSALAIVLNTRKGYNAVAAVLGYWWSAPLTFAAMLVAQWFLVPGPYLQMIIILWFATCAITERTMLHPVFAWKPLAFIGVFSYGAYLIHLLCANIAKRLLHQEFSVTVFLLTAVLTLGISYLSFRYFETPILKLKRKFESSTQRAGDELAREKALTEGGSK